MTFEHLYLKKKKKDSCVINILRTTHVKGLRFYIQKHIHIQYKNNFVLII
jgi:hypothetical protein